MFRLALLYSVFVGTIQCSSIIPKKYPLFLQCDPKWGNDLMGGNNTKTDTICDQGCAMSSLSMALNGKGYRLRDGSDIDPGTLNAWLRSNKGYTCIDGDCDNLVLDSPNRLAATGDIEFLSEKEKPSADAIRQWIEEMNPVAIAHVRDKTHFVLLVGYLSDGSDLFLVNDPFFPVTNYSYGDISDVITYTVAQQAPGSGISS